MTFARILLPAVAVLIMLTDAGFSFSMSSGTYNITDAVISSGGGISKSAHYKLDLSIGQPVAGYSESVSAGYKLYLGRAWGFLQSLLFPPKTGVKVETGYLEVKIGSISKIYLEVSNGEAETKEFPLYVGSLDQSKNWVWFTGHRTDQNRRNITVVVGPRQKKTVTIDFFAPLYGSYTLFISPNEDYAKKYGEVHINVVYKAKGFFGTTPDIGWLGVAIVIIVAGLAAGFGSGWKREVS